MSEWMIELQNVTKRYGDVLANDRLNLKIRRGELITLLGPSGCGKTTALRCITGQHRPDEGRVFIGEQDVTDLPTHRRELGMVFQNFALFPHMSVFQNVEFPLMIRGLSRDERRKMVMEALRLIRMEGFEDRMPRQLSGGQQQRVGLARALVYRPKVLLLDEPLSNLDAKLREEMRFEIKEVITKLEMTAVYVTHDQAEALALSDRVAVMKNGRIEQIGSPRDIYERPLTSFVADFIGLSDFFRGRVVSVEGAQVRVDIDGLELTVVQHVPNVQIGQVITLFIRPNNVQLMPPGNGSAANSFVGQIGKMTYLGEAIDYRVILPNGLEVRVQTDGSQYFVPGSSVSVRLPPDRCHILVETDQSG